MLTIDWFLKLLNEIVSVFSTIWEKLSTPIGKTISNSSVVGPLIDFVLPNAIADLSPAVVMFGVGLFVYLAIQLVAWILTWLPLL